MTWADLHRASEAAAIEAEEAFRKGDASQAALLYAKAAEFEQQALGTVDPAKIRTRGITAVSAVSLWYKAIAYERAEQLAYSTLGDPAIPQFARADLRNLVQASRRKRTNSGRFQETATERILNNGNTNQACSRCRWKRVSACRWNSAK